MGNAGIRGVVGQRAMLVSKEEEDRGRCWHPSRRRTEDDAGAEEEDNFTAGDRNSEKEDVNNNILLFRSVLVELSIACITKRSLERSSLEVIWGVFGWRGFCDKVRMTYVALYRGLVKIGTLFFLIE